MKVILFDNVKGLGRQGDLVNVSEGYFRNLLKPKNLAEEATPAALKRYEKMKKKALEVAELKLQEAKDVAEKMANTKFVIKAKAGESDKLFGAVTSADVAKCLEENGYAVDKKLIDIPNPIKTLGGHHIRVKLHSEVNAEVVITVEKL